MSTFISSLKFAFRSRKKFLVFGGIVFIILNTTLLYIIGEPMDSALLQSLLTVLIFWMIILAYDTYLISENYSEISALKGSKKYLKQVKFSGSMSDFFNLFSDLNSKMSGHFKQESEQSFVFYPEEGFKYRVKYTYQTDDEIVRIESMTDEPLSDYELFLLVSRLKPLNGKLRSH